jgi:hypothetical protein
LLKAPRFPLGLLRAFLQFCLLSFLSYFLHQVFKPFDATRPENNILHIFDSLLRLHDEGRTLQNGNEVLYSSEYYMELLSLVISYIKFLSHLTRHVQKITFSIFLIVYLGYTMKVGLYKTAMKFYTHRNIIWNYLMFCLQHLTN